MPDTFGTSSLEWPITLSSAASTVAMSSATQLTTCLRYMELNPVRGTRCRARRVPVVKLSCTCGRHRRSSPDTARLCSGALDPERQAKHLAGLVRSCQNDLYAEFA